MAQKLELSFGPAQILKLFILILFRKCARFFNLSFFNREAEDYFTLAIKQTIRFREKNSGNNYDDFLQLMLEARKDKTNSSLENNYLDDNHIVANCVLFILAGYNSTRATLLFSFYALAINPDVQERLRKEVEETVDANPDEDKGEFISYEDLNKMAYLDMFVTGKHELFCNSILNKFKVKFQILKVFIVS